MLVNWGRSQSESQGHIHKISPYSGWSTPEIYEIWSGEAIIYMQEYAEDQRSMLCGTCLSGGCSDRSSIGYDATISANPRLPLTFGALVR